MTIRNLQSYIEALWDWAFLNSCFAPTKIRVSDIDGVVERNGHVMFIEAKRPHVTVPYGQQILFRALANLGCWVLIIWGEQNQPEKVGLWSPKARQVEVHEATEDRIKDFVRRWFKWADRTPFKR